MNTISYGPHDSQTGDLYLPNAPQPPVVCLLHGGFWRMPYGKHQFSAIATDLASRGYAVWNMEYRRLGSPGGGWPGTLQDIALAIDHLATLAKNGIDIDLHRVVVAGHSAGGQLALCAAAHKGHPNTFLPIRVRPISAAGLAPLSDLSDAYNLNLGRGAAGEFLGGSPVQQRERYLAASPIELLPLGTPQIIIHGTIDEAVPISQSRRYVTSAQAYGDTVEFVELPYAGHMDFLDPGNEAHSVFCKWLATRLTPA